MTTSSYPRPARFRRRENRPRGRPRGAGYPLVRASILLAAVLPGPVSGQSEDPNAPPPTSEDSAGMPWRSIALGAGVLGAAFLLDQPTRDLALDVQGGTADDVGRVLGDYGTWRTSAPLLAGGGVLVGLALDGTDGAARTLAGALGVLAGSMANEALNQALGRRRPREEMGAWQFDPFHGHASFGSGHAAYTFAIAGAVDEITEGPWAVPFYAVAGGVALSRIYKDRHWLSDVIVGSAIGLWVSRRATRAALGELGLSTSGPEAAAGASASGPSVEWWASHRGAGITLRH